MNVLNLDINFIKENSHKTKISSLRFDIELIKIEINDKLYDFKGFSTKTHLRSSSKRMYKIYLENILFDTGNEYDFCVLFIDYYEKFKEKTSLTKDDFDENKYIASLPVILSRKKYKFIFDDSLEFYSKIGFIPGSGFITLSLNIGIDFFRKHFSIIYPDKIENIFYFYCQGI